MYEHMTMREFLAAEGVPPNVIASTDQMQAKLDQLLGDLKTPAFVMLSNYITEGGQNEYLSDMERIAFSLALCALNDSYSRIHGAVQSA